MNAHSELSQDHERPSFLPEVAARVLVVEDDESISGLLKKRLELDGFGVDLAGDGEAVEVLVSGRGYDLMILDLKLPQMDGIEVLRRVRTTNDSLPIMILTGRTEVEERVKVLDLGADDYLPKPFEYLELAARARALLRRLRQSGPAISRFEDLELNRIHRTVKRAGRSIELTPKEFSLLEYLMLNPGQCLSRAMIMEHAWKLLFSDMSNVVDVYINYLRNKVDKDFERKLIRTVRGAGYRLGNVLPGQGD